MCGGACRNLGLLPIWASETPCTTGLALRGASLVVARGHRYSDNVDMGLLFLQYEKFDRVQLHFAHVSVAEPQRSGCSGARTKES